MSKSTLRIATLLAIFGVPLILQPRTALSGDSCNALLTLGLYNVTQSSSAQDGNNLALSTFCSYDYSSSQTSTERRAAIKASFFGLFGGGVSGGTADSEIVTTQHQLCTSGYNSSAYSNQASAYARTVYQGTLDAWNKCQALSLRGLDFNVLTSSTLQGVTIMIKAATGVSARFSGLYQDGLGTSVCKRTLPPPSGSSVGTAVTVNDTTSFAFSAAQLVTISCQRNMQEDADGNYFADAQDLTIVTSADSIRIPLAAVGSLARSTVEQVTAEIAEQTTAQTEAAKAQIVQQTTAQVAANKAWVGMVPLGELSRFHSGCALNFAKLNECVSAAKAYCINRGLGAIGVVQNWGSTGLQIGCIK